MLDIGLLGAAWLNPRVWVTPLLTALEAVLEKLENQLDINF